MTSGERDPGVELLAIGLNALQQDAALPNFSRPCQGLGQVFLRLKRFAIQTQKHRSATDAFVRPFARSYGCDNESPSNVQTRLDLGRCRLELDLPVGDEFFFIGCSSHGALGGLGDWGWCVGTSQSFSPMEFHLFLNALSIAANLYGDACAGTVFGQLLLERWEAGHRDAVDGFDAVAGLQPAALAPLPRNTPATWTPGSRWSTWMPR